VVIGRGRCVGVPVAAGIRCGRVTTRRGHHGAVMGAGIWQAVLYRLGRVGAGVSNGDLRSPQRHSARRSWSGQGPLQLTGADGGKTVRRPARPQPRPARQTWRGQRHPARPWRRHRCGRRRRARLGRLPCRQPLAFRRRAWSIGQMLGQPVRADQEAGRRKVLDATPLTGVGLGPADADGAGDDIAARRGAGLILGQVCRRRPAARPRCGRGSAASGAVAHQIDAAVPGPDTGQFRPCRSSAATVEPAPPSPLSREWFRMR
jgi:hypothetical protein